ncbi:MAG: amino acid permease [Candidatus Babeliales bacterium]
MESAKKISFWSAVLISVNIIVGAGIFFNPTNIAQVAGSYGFLSWGLIGLILFPIVWSLSQAAHIFPGEGGFFAYCSKGINRTAGFVALWAYILGYAGTAGFFCMRLKELCVSQMGMLWAAEHPIIVNLLLIALFSALNLINAAIVSRLQSAAALIKLIPLFFVIGVFAFYFGPHVVFTADGLSNLGLTVPMAIFGFFGFEACCCMGHLIEGGPKKASKAILVAFFSTVILYMLYHLGLTYIMGTENLASMGSVNFPQFLGFGSALTVVLQALIVFFVLFSVCNAFYGTASLNISNLSSLADMKLLPGRALLTKTNTAGRPYIIVGLHSIALFVLTLLVNDINVMCVMTCMGVSTAFFLTLVALLLTYKKRNDYLNLAITCISFCSYAAIMYFGWMKAGATNVDRLTNLAPIIVGMIIGFALYTFQTRSKKLAN